MEEKMADLRRYPRTKVNCRPPSGRTFDISAIVWRADQDGSAFFFVGVDGDADVYAEASPRPRLPQD
jgi:hypothetical protein